MGAGSSTEAEREPLLGPTGAEASRQPVSSGRGVREKMAGSEPVLPAGAPAGDGVELLGTHPELGHSRLRLHQVRHRGAGDVGPGGLHPLAAVHVVNG